MSGYDYNICFKPTETHSNADGLSRLSLHDQEAIGETKTVGIFNLSQIQALPVTCNQVQTATWCDLVLSKIVDYVRRGWPKQVPDNIQPKQEEITIESGCLPWGIRVIIPKSPQDRMLQTLHQNHPGVTRMKSIARSYMWWLGIDKDIENLAKSCLSCLENKSQPAAAPLHPWIWPNTPWKRIHIDFADPFLDKMFLVVVDAHSKWPEVIQMSSTTSFKTIEALRSIFAKYGLPEQLVSDNGPQFTSEEFAHFMKVNGIKHIRSAPYHPSTNGLAERFVQTFKRAMKISAQDEPNLNTRLSQFLLGY